jgi:prepilin-type processing-associated H-X9-DG protein
MWGNLVSQLTDMIPYNSPLLWCPSRPVGKLANIYSGSGYDYGITYYISNIPAGYPWGRLDRVTKPEKTGYLFESGGNYQMDLSRLQLPLFSKSTWRHGGNQWSSSMSNALFIDGHVESLRTGDIPASANNFPFSNPVGYFIGIGIGF